MKFTRGPWHVEVEDGSIGTINTANGVMVAQAQQVAPISKDLKQIERRANAQLISAAPELLEALSSLLSEFTQNGGRVYGKTLDQAKAAIAKATGGEV